MSSSSERITDVIAGPLTVGLSAIVGITGAAYQSALLLKYLSGGSLAIGGSLCTDGNVLAVGGANGYLMGTSEVLSLNTCGTIWLTAKSATVTVMVIKTLTN